MLKKQGSSFLVRIPYRGVAAFANDLLGGRVDFGIFVLSSTLLYIRSNKLIAVSTTESSRSPLTPDITALSKNLNFSALDIESGLCCPGQQKLLNW